MSKLLVLQHQIKGRALLYSPLLSGCMRGPCNMQQYEDFACDCISRLHLHHLICNLHAKANNVVCFSAAHLTLDCLCSQVQKLQQPLAARSCTESLHVMMLSTCRLSSCSSSSSSSLQRFRTSWRCSLERFSHRSSYSWIM